MKRLVLLLGFFLTLLLGLFYPQYRSWAPGEEREMRAAMAGSDSTAKPLETFFDPQQNPYFDRLDFAISDSYMKKHAKRVRSDRVAIIDIDERALKELGQWPWPRHLIAKLVDRLFELGATVVAFDIIFPEADRSSPKQVRQGLLQRLQIDLPLTGIPEAEQDYDEIFARSLQGRAVVLGCELKNALPDVDGRARRLRSGRSPSMMFRLAPGTPADIEKAVLESEDGVTASLPLLVNACRGIAFIDSDPDADNINRRVPLIKTAGPDNTPFPSLALETFRIYQQEKIASPGRYETVIVHLNAEEGISHLSLDDINIPTDSWGRLMVNYRELIRTDPKNFSFEPSFSAATLLGNTVELKRSDIEDRIVFIGTSAAGLRDIRATPLTQNFSGVEIQATIVDNLLAGDALLYRTANRAGIYLAIFLAGTLLTLLVYFSTSWISLLVFLGLEFAFYSMGSWLFGSTRNVFEIGSLMALMALIYLALLVAKYWFSERKERQIRDQFGKMVSPVVLQHLERDPKSLEHKRAEATMLFSDIQGFTRIANGLPPEKTSALMNAYLSPLAEIILADQAYLDKYIGDMVMAVYGLPYPLDNHARAACLSALKLRRKLDEIRPQLQAEYGYEIRNRTGLHCGEVVAGFMGSEERHEYTVMGDAVNVAARLEPLNKNYGTEIIISDTLRQAAGNGLVTRHLDRVVLRGRVEPLDVYELVGESVEVRERELEAIHLYEEGLRALLQEDLVRAHEQIQFGLTAAPNDSPMQRLARRIELEQQKFAKG